jgi:hypothetical protein
MDQFSSNAPIMEPKPGPAGWFPVWIKAVTKPSEQTFAEITDHPDAVSKTAFIWIFIAGMLATIVMGILQAIVMAMGFSNQLGSGGVGTFAITMLCASPVAGLFSVLFFALGVAIIQWIAKLFGGVGTFDKMAYAMAAISVPFTLVSMVLSPFNAIPYLGICVGAISAGLGIYALVLEIMAVKGVNKFGWGAAAGSVLLPVLVIGFICGCIVIASLMMLGPVVGNVFSSINQSLAP